MKAVKQSLRLAIALGALLVMGDGCARDPSYADQRPPVDELAPGNTGLQAKDVVAATDRMAADLLALPELNASDKQWTIVFTKVENHTTDPGFSYDVFSQRLKTAIARQGHGRVTLVENRSQYKKLQNEELEPAAGDSGGLAGTNPDYGLSITVDEMPNRATSYYLVTATLNSTTTRTIPWTQNYEVQTAR